MTDASEQYAKDSSPVQTFNPKYRQLFGLTATIEQILNGVDLLNRNFEFVCIDMLYGLHGQSISELIKDLHSAIQLETKLIDLYPINNIVIQERLGCAYKKENLSPTSGLDKFGLSVLAQQYMRANGYLPHNGHGFIKSNTGNNAIVTDEYTFEYHEAVYGYKGHEIISFGSFAYTSIDGLCIGNPTNTKKYIENLNNNNHIDMYIGQYDKSICENKGIALHLPYHGVAEKRKMDLTLIDEVTKEKLNEAIKRGLVIETPDSLQLTQSGLSWYVNLLYYFSPQSDQTKLESMINQAENKEKRSIEEWRIYLRH